MVASYIITKHTLDIKTAANYASWQALALPPMYQEVETEKYVSTNSTETINNQTIKFTLMHGNRSWYHVMNKTH